MNVHNAYEWATGPNSLSLNVQSKISCMIIKEKEECLKAEIYFVYGISSFTCSIEWWFAMCLIQCYFLLVYIDV